MITPNRQICTQMMVHFDRAVRNSSSARSPKGDGTTEITAADLARQLSGSTDVLCHPELRSNVLTCGASSSMAAPLP
jgi:hypothetical protein